MKLHNKTMNILSRIWDPRPNLAQNWLDAAEKYEDRLKTNPSSSPQIVEAILQERHRIQSLFNELLPEFSNKISVVITPNALVEHLAIFSWDHRLYVLVSGALIGRPYDHPEDTGIKAWQWLARHEAAHIRGNHLPWLFHARRLFRFTSIFCCAGSLFLGLFASKEILNTWLILFLSLYGSTWIIQTITTLFLEWRADCKATEEIQDPSILKETEESLHRMNMQVRNLPLGWIRYALSMIFIDPHPPFILRRWLLRRKLNALNHQTRSPMT